MVLQNAKVEDGFFSVGRKKQQVSPIMEICVEHQLSARALLEAVGTQPWTLRSTWQDEES